MNESQPPSTSEDPIIFQLEVQRGTEPIEGMLRAGERELGFTGWVGLAGALERVIEATEGSAWEQKSGGDPP